MEIGFFRFATTVRLVSSRSVDECELSLSNLVGESSELRKSSHPFAGHVDRAGGVVWQKLTLFTVYPMRILRFRFVSEPSGCALEGKLDLKRTVRIPVAIYLSFCISFFLVSLARLPVHRDNWLGLLGPALGFAMIFGWTLLGIWLNKRSERQMLRAVELALTDDEQGRLAAYVLS